MATMRRAAKVMNREVRYLKAMNQRYMGGYSNGRPGGKHSEPGQFLLRLRVSSRREGRYISTQAPPFELDSTAREMK